jgi:hypothetical protein
VIPWIFWSYHVLNSITECPLVTSCESAMIILVSYTVRNFSTNWRTVSVLDKVLHNGIRTSYWALHCINFFGISIWPSTIMSNIFLGHLTPYFLSVYTVPSARVMEILVKSSAWKEKITLLHFISCYPLTINRESILERSFKSYLKIRDSPGNRSLWKADLKYPTSPFTGPEFYNSLHHGTSENYILITLYSLRTKTHFLILY